MQTESSACSRALRLASCGLDVRLRGVSRILALFFFLDLLLRPALGRHEAAEVFAGAGGHALGLDVLRGRRDGLVRGAADDLRDVALDGGLALGLELRLGVGRGAAGGAAAVAGGRRPAAASPGLNCCSAAFCLTPASASTVLRVSTLSRGRVRAHERRGAVAAMRLVRVPVPRDAPDGDVEDDQPSRNGTSQSHTGSGEAVLRSPSRRNTWAAAASNGVSITRPPVRCGDFAAAAPRCS